MLLSAEIRLFWLDQKPSALEAWFLDARVHSGPAGGGSVRTDVYLRDPDQTELGVKTRGEKPGVEIKGLVGTPGEVLQFGSCVIPVELWSKWPSRKLAFDRDLGLTLRKTRWLRLFDDSQPEPMEIALNSEEKPRDGQPLPKEGCHVEWTEVEIPPRTTCWTLGFEAFGGMANVETILRAVVRAMNTRNPPPAPGGQPLSYPALIRRLICTASLPTR